MPGRRCLWASSTLSSPMMPCGRRERIARELAAGPTEAYGAIKRLFAQAPDRSLESQLEEEAQTLAAISRTADAREGVRAFVEKRKPVFVGK